MRSQHGCAAGRIKSKRIGTHLSYRREDGSDGVGMDVLRGVRRPRPTTSHKPRHCHDKNPSEYQNEDNGDEMDHIELAPLCEEIFRCKVPSSVGFYDDEDDDNGEDINIHEAKSHRQGKKKTGRRKKRREKDIDPTGSTEEDGADRVGEDDELCDDDNEVECESINISNENHAAPLWHASVKMIMAKLIWIMVAIAATTYVVYDDEMLEESETDEDLRQKKQKEPYSYKGYKDARIPDDDVFGVELLEIGDNETEGSGKIDQERQYQKHSSHKPTGIVQIDSLWEQLNGYAEMEEPYDSLREVPVFWHVPKCGGTTLQDLMMHCIGMVGANEIGGAYVKDSGPLEIVQLENGNRYVNVDMAHLGGITHAKDMRFGQSGLADVVLTSWFDQTASVFDDNHKGRCFTLVRHPIRRAISMFYYLKDATWENSYNEVYRTMNIEEYASSQYAEDNWMVRFLTHEMSGGVYDRHLDLAKQVLESKCLVGIMEEFTASFKRFNQYFGWQQHDFGGPVAMNVRGTCVSRVIGSPDNAHSHPSHEEGSEVWNLLLQKNRYDIFLYEHAVHLFHDVQSELVRQQQT